MPTYDELKQRAENAEAALEEALRSKSADAVDPADTAVVPPDTADDATQQDTAPATRSGDEVIAEAKAKADAGDELTHEHVRALEHPAEFAGKDVPVTTPSEEA